MQLWENSSSCSNYCANSSGNGDDGPDWMEGNPDDEPDWLKGNPDDGPDWVKVH